MQKTYLTSEQLLRDSFELAKRVIESGYRPTFLLGVWRGGAPIAIAVQEVLVACNIPCDHDVVRVSSYNGIKSRTQDIKVSNLDCLAEQLTTADRLLIVDDVHDSGLSMHSLIDKIQKVTTVAQTKIAVAYYKPTQSKVNFEPDFYVTETDNWLVFPHELMGLSANELDKEKPGIADIKSLVLKAKLATQQ